MPIYAYKCSACGHQLDALQKIADAPLTDCPSCGAPALAKQLTAAGFQLKGSGWYATDFKNGGAKAPPAAGKADGEGAASAGDGSTDKSGNKSGDQPGEKTAAKPADAPAGKSADSAAPPAKDKPASGGPAGGGPAAGS